MGWRVEENDFENNNENDVQHHKNELKIALLNVEGLITKNRNKLEEEVVTLFENNYIILLTEMWSNEETDFQLEGYVQLTLSGKRHKKARTGGLAIIIREE